MHGLVAAPNDQSPSIVWYDGNGTFVTTGATDTTLGAGVKKQLSS
jgi:hypothetical protein